MKGNKEVGIQQKGESMIVTEYTEEQLKKYVENQGE